MDNFFTRLLQQECLRKKANNIITFNELTFFIEQEAAVKVAIPGNAHIRTMLNDRITGAITVFNQNWIRDAIREVTISFIMNFDKFNRNL